MRSNASALLILILILLARASGAGATSIAVNVTNDELNGDSDCSLREAIQAANGDSAVSGCPAGSGADIITVPAGLYRLRKIGPSENANSTGDLDVGADVTIKGGAENPTVIDGNGTDRVLHVHAGTVVVEDVVIQNGAAPAGADGPDCIGQTSCFASGQDGEEGGGILTHGGTNATLRRVILQNNASGTGGAAGDVNCPTAGADCETFGGSGGNGGGVSAHGTLDIEQSLITQNRAGLGGAAGAILACGTGGDCFSSAGNAGDGAGVINTGGSLDLRTTTVTDNVSPDWGGGVYCHHGSTCTIRDSTIAYNEARIRGGGLAGITTNATVANTTISANRTGASGVGGGIYSHSGALELDFVTIAGNSAGINGGGLARASGSVTLRNSIVADNTGGGSPNCNGIVTSGGYNHVESLTGCTLALGTGDSTGSDPALQPVADNGGLTETQALSLVSVARDAIPAGTNGCGTTVATDQRGGVRPTDGDNAGGPACDKGAFELEGSTDCSAMLPACDAAVNSKLTLKDLTPDAGKDTFKWTYSGGSSDLTQAHFGNPTSGTVYDVCLYSGMTLRSAVRLDDSSKWLPVTTTGYRYKDTTASSGGITAVSLKAGTAGKSKVTVSGRGDNLPDPLPLTPVPPSITVVVRNSDTATCFSAEYGSATLKPNGLFTAP